MEVLTVLNNGRRPKFHWVCVEWDASIHWTVSRQSAVNSEHRRQDGPLSSDQCIPKIARQICPGVFLLYILALTEHHDVCVSPLISTLEPVLIPTFCKGNTAPLVPLGTRSWFDLWWSYLPEVSNFLTAECTITAWQPRENFISTFWFDRDKWRTTARSDMQANHKDTSTYRVVRSYFVFCSKY
jgi:hypothetical protein